MLKEIVRDRGSTGDPSPSVGTDHHTGEALQAQVLWVVEGSPRHPAAWALGGHSPPGGQVSFQRWVQGLRARTTFEGAVPLIGASGDNETK